MEVNACNRKLKSLILLEAKKPIFMTQKLLVATDPAFSII